MKCDKYIGFDLHQATTVVAVLDAEGKVVMETIVATEAAAIIRFLRRRLSIKLCLRAGSSSVLKARLKHRIELSESNSDGSGDGSATAVLQGGDGQSEFQLQGVVGMKVSATVAAHDFKLAIDGFDDIGGGERFAHVFGIFQERQVVFAFFA